MIRHDDPTNIIGLQQNLLPDLPDYDTAINDPRYAKKPPVDGSGTPTPLRTDVSSNTTSTNPSNSSISTAPPPYSEAVATEPFNIMTHVVMQNEVTQHETQTQTPSLEQVNVEVVEPVLSQMEPEIPAPEISSSVNRSEETGTPRH